MRLRQLTFTLTALFAIEAVFASSGSAAVETNVGEWYTGATTEGVTTLAGSQAITAEIAEHPAIGSKIEMKLLIGGSSLRGLATGLTCVECSIENREVTSKAGKIAYGAGRLNLTGATIVEPANCTISSETGVLGQILTKPLVTHDDWQDTVTTNKRSFVQFIPAAGATAVLWQFKLGGAGCAIAGSFNAKGSLFGELKSNRGEMKTVQELVVGPEVQATTGGAVNVGISTVTLTGTAKVSAGKNFFGIK